ncbi:acetamidase/formamidase family protein [Salinisphaera sp. SPP-AMP-43]|uniref:acetamidase/formamidase family protein n=1 Tax=Salinisphaera sp. SPP-AMP-43 TaxID=3121288 RepID=UPI003C6E18EF
MKSNDSDDAQHGTGAKPANGRREFLKGALASGGAAAFAQSGFAAAAGSGNRVADGTGYHYLPATVDTVHWGVFSKNFKPALTVDSGDLATIEVLTHQAGDDYDRMIKGDSAVEQVYHWTKDGKNVDRRGAGPMDAPNGAGAGWGVHICTGPVYVRDAEPGDVLEVRILDMYPRPSGNLDYQGKTYGTNLAAWWGYQYHDLIEEPKPREVVTIYELDANGHEDFARPVYNYRWLPMSDPSGVRHDTYDYPGLIADHSQLQKNHDIMPGVRIPIRPHFGTIGLAPAESDLVNSIPPSYTGGNIDDWRAGKGSTIYFPVSVKGAYFSVGDSHAAQGDSECCGTAIECSFTGVFQFKLHKKDALPGTKLEALQWPLLETKDEWVIHGFSYPNYLAHFGSKPEDQQAVFKNSSVDRAMRDAFRKMRAFLMHTQGLSEDEAISLMSVAVDFSVTQVVDGNWGVHASLPKRIFTGSAKG